VPAANKSIAVNYEMSVFDSIRKMLLKNLTVTDISCADRKLNNICHLSHGGPDVRGSGSKPHALP